MKNAVFWDITPFGSCINRRFGERIASIFRVSRIGEPETTLSATSSMLRLLVTANVVSSSPVLVTLMMKAIRSPNRRFLLEVHGGTPQKMALFIVTAVKASNLT
jgi:hypothetical protein